MEKPSLVTITAEPRESGAKMADALRSGHAVPAVLYGPSTENINLSVKELDLERLLKVEDAMFVDVSVSGSTYRTVIQNVDFHPVTDRPIHADFYVFSPDRPMTVSVPVLLKGTAPGVIAGGRLDHNLKKVKVRTLPESIPAHLSADITKLNIGESLRIRDLKLENMTVNAQADRTVVLIKPPRGGKKAEETTGKKK